MRLYYSSNGIQLIALIVMGIDCGVCGVWDSCVCALNNKPAATFLYKCTHPTYVLCACKHFQSRGGRRHVLTLTLPLSTVEESTETIENALHEAAKRGVWSVHTYVVRRPRVHLCNFLN